jgi:hypothetical protein
MTVAQLRQELERFDDDALVVFANDYGDRSHTMQIGGIETVSESKIRESAYSQSGFALPHEDEDGDDDDDSESESDDERPLYVVLKE